MIHFVIPCGAEKAEAPAPARELYLGQAFRLALAAAEAEAAATERDLGTPARVLILSAKHGLVSPDAELAPYDVKVSDAEAIGPVALAASLVLAGVEEGDELYAMLPRAYRELLAEAAELAHGGIVQDVYEAAPGIGWQRGVASSLIRTAGKELGR
jgi:hypothetical protein